MAYYEIPHTRNYEQDLGYFIKLAKMLEARIEVLEDEMDAIETRMDEAEANIKDLQSRMAEAEANIKDLQSRMAEAESNISNLQTKLTEHIKTFNDFIVEYNQFQTNYNLWKNSIDTSIANINNKIATIETTITTIQQSITNINSKITTIENNITTINNTLSNFETRISALENGSGGGDITPVFEENGNAITYYVASTSGLDTNDGLTSTTPLKSIQLAIDKICSKGKRGTIKFIESGTYWADCLRLSNIIVKFELGTSTYQTVNFYLQATNWTTTDVLTINNSVLDFVDLQVHMPRVDIYNSYLSLQGSDLTLNGFTYFYNSTFVCDGNTIGGVTYSTRLLGHAPIIANQSTIVHYYCKDLRTYIFAGDFGIGYYDLHDSILTIFRGEYGITENSDVSSDSYISAENSTIQLLNSNISTTATATSGIRLDYSKGDGSISLLNVIYGDHNYIYGTPTIETVLKNAFKSDAGFTAETINNVIVPLTFPSTTASEIESETI
jgi:predicted  nucleic acid-binding Zn-ribbon protein